MKTYVDTIKATVSLAYRLEDDAFYDGQYRTIVHMISLIYERTARSQPGQATIRGCTPQPGRGDRTCAS